MDLHLKATNPADKDHRICLTAFVHLLFACVPFFLFSTYSYTNCTNSCILSTYSVDWFTSIRRNNVPIKGVQTLKDVLLNYNWKERDFSKIPVDDQTMMINKIIQFDIKEPTRPIDSKCKVPDLTSYTEQMCQNAGPAFTGKLRKLGTKMAHIVNFGFEVDVLEILLNELYPIVDKIFICECSFIHGDRGTKKPYVWDLIKDQTRFRKFRNKVVQIKITETAIHRASVKYNILDVEIIQEMLIWHRFLEWNKVNNLFSDEDVVGFGNTEEIASIQNMNLLKQCETKTNVDIGMWNTRSRITERESTDCPVPGHKFAYFNPTFFTIAQAKEFQRTKSQYPSRQHGRSPNIVLGGLHMSTYKYLPQFILNLITKTESTFKEYMEKDFYNHAILEGMAFDKVKDGNLCFAVSVSYPMSDLYIPLLITIHPNGNYEIAKDLVLDNVVETLDTASVE